MSFSKILLLLGAPAIALADTPSFSLIRFDDKTGLDVTTLAGDGGHAAGILWGTEGGPMGFYWNAETGFETIPGARFLFGSSTDGSCLTGLAPTGEPVLWTKANGIEKLPPFEGGKKSGQAWATTDDATLVVGSIANERGAQTAMYWTPTDGTHAIFTDTRNHLDSRIVDVTRDGSLSAGWVRDRFGDFRALRWSLDNGVEYLPALDQDHPISGAYCVNNDGHVIAGMAQDSDGSTRPVRWVDGIIERLSGDLPGMIFDGAFDVDASGDVIVGSALDTASGQHVSWIWMPDIGFELMSDYLKDQGLALEDVSLLNRYISVSDDGLSFAGTAYTTDDGDQGWIAHVPEPASGLLLCCLFAIMSRRLRSSRSSE